MSALPDARARRLVRGALLQWYAANRRAFPWRATRDPYAVLVSEVMLQQTQAARVTERFPRFMARFPTARSLADAPAASVIAEWSGLGYNRRALALRRAAAIVARDGWPRDVPGLEALPGVGRYTARAVASIAFDMRVGVVDTNVRRWLLRRFRGADEPRALQALSDALAADGGADAASWTHATMEFGASLCRSGVPPCEICPIAVGCPSRGAAPRIPVPRQGPLRGSARGYRGAVLRLLSSADGHTLGEAALQAGLAIDLERVGPALDADGWEMIVSGLERDGLVHRSGRGIRLGPATIGQ